MYEDDTKDYFPYGSWYTVWSSCYYDDGSYYGPDAEGDGCGGESEDSPGFTLIPALAAVGFLVAVPGDGANDLLGQLTSTTVGATTLDLSRTWEEGIWEHTFAVAVDATDGRVVGWTKLSQVA